MTASELVTELMQEIQANGGDFHVAVSYWTEMDVKDVFELETKEEVMAKLEDIEGALNSDDLTAML
jgi:hypothetical protein